MKVVDVPQDNDASYEGAKKLCYALDENGLFVAARTNGWHVEETVKSLAWKNIELDLERTKVRVSEGKSSPLEYFMKLRQMDAGLLAENMQISKWRVQWHLRPLVFNKLKHKWIERYANCLEVPADVLQKRAEPC